MSISTEGMEARAARRIDSFPLRKPSQHSALSHYETLTFSAIPPHRKPRCAEMSWTWSCVLGLRKRFTRRRTSCGLLALREATSW